jgi:hypothetical protein
VDGKLWSRLYRIVRKLGDSKRGPRQQFSDAEILLWYFWAVWNDRPLSWLSWKGTAPQGLKSRRRPSAATLSRRLRSESLAALLVRIERWLTRPRQMLICKYIDAKPLPIGHAGKDPDARFGRAAKGYRLYVIVDQMHQLHAWRVLPNNVSEVRVAQELIHSLEGAGYLLGDGEYDARVLYDAAERRHHQLVAPRAKPGTGFSHRPLSNARRRSCELLERDRWIDNGFGGGLINARHQIERFFGNLTCFAGGLGPLPAWIRTLPRVERWVRAKLTINAVRIQIKQRLKSMMK